MVTKIILWSAPKNESSHLLRSVYLDFPLTMDRLPQYCENSFIDSMLRRSLFINTYILQNIVNEANEKNYESSGLWLITNPDIARKWYAQVTNNESSK